MKLFKISNLGDDLPVAFANAAEPCDCAPGSQKCTAKCVYVNTTYEEGDIYVLEVIDNTSEPSHNIINEFVS